jgi:hypothetical protein
MVRGSVLVASHRHQLGTPFSNLPGLWWTRSSLLPPADLGRPDIRKMFLDEDRSPLRRIDERNNVIDCLFSTLGSDVHARSAQTLGDVQRECKLSLRLVNRRGKASIRRIRLVNGTRGVHIGRVVSYTAFSTAA